MLEVRPFSLRDRVFKIFADRVQSRDPDMLDHASAVIAAVRAGGCDALIAEERAYGCPIAALEQLRVSEAEIADARDKTPESFLTALSLARVNMRKFHEYQRRRGYLHDDGDGVRLTRRSRPLARIGIVSTGSCADLLAYTVPAQVAGVGAVALAVAPNPDGSLDPSILTAAKVLGIEDVFRLSGAQAVAAFAYGIPPVNRVDSIVGAGGVAAEAAKLLVDNVCGTFLDKSADELVIIADSSANAKFIAADFLAEAESGKDSLAVLLTTDRLLAEAVRIEIDRLAELLPNPARLRETAATRCGLFVFPSLTTAMDAANRLAPARLGLQTRDNEELVVEVDSAGTVYMGAWTCQATGDLFSGLNPIQPGWGRARWSSGPGVDDFIQEMNVVEYSHERLLVAGRHVMELAYADKRPARAEAVRERLELLRMTNEWKSQQ